MKIIVFGATGNMGRRVLASAVRTGHEVTAFVRNPEKLMEQQGEPIAGQVNIVAENILDPQSVYQALSHQDAAIIAAGSVANGEEFIRIVDNIVTSCEDHPQFSGRVWVMGGAGLLEIPHTSRIGNDLPGIPPMFRYHNENWDRLRRTKLDWSFLCPGTMVDGTEEERPGFVHVSADLLPIAFPESTKDLSEAELSGLLFSRLSELDVAYEDAAEVMLNHLELSGPFKGRRVGVAYRNGEVVSNQAEVGR
ncbi:NAD(P)H-binding protein [Paenibacillus sp. CC-CFT747]|nr:NAD(P)H-binding protein [Paenibacillus sp. CC-CFT747]